MPDFCMCQGDDCPLKNQCYRYRAVPDLAQPYLSDLPYDFEKQVCKGFKDVVKTSAPIRQLNDDSWDVIVSDHERASK